MNKNWTLLDLIILIILLLVFVLVVVDFGFSGVFSDMISRLLS